ncbi:MAG: LCP family protein [Filifactor alocis]|nr:LCP family protein [Filifactor alocis]
MRHFLKVFLITVLSVGIIGTIGTKVYLEHDDKKKKEEITPEVVEVLDKKEGITERTNILVLGVDAPERDREGDIPRSDTMMLVSLDPNKNSAFILSIPRDTRVVLPGRRKATKINHAHRFGGPELSIQAVKELLGIPIHHYAVVDYKALYQIVDKVGGVEITIDHPGGMHYTDNAIDPPLRIDLDQGTHILDGKKAEQYLRYRKGYTAGDLGRVEAQQKFISALIDKVLSPESITKLPQLFETVYKNVETDLSKKDIFQLSVSATKLKPEYIIKDVLAGESMYIGSISYFLMDEPIYKDQIEYMMAGEYSDWEHEKFHKRSTLDIVAIQREHGGEGKKSKTKKATKTIPEEQNIVHEDALLEEQEQQEVPGTTETTGVVEGMEQNPGDQTATNSGDGTSTSNPGTTQKPSNPNTGETPSNPVNSSEPVTLQPGPPADSKQEPSVPAEPESKPEQSVPAEPEPVEGQDLFS